MNKLNFLLIIALLATLFSCVDKPIIDPLDGCAPIDIVNKIDKNTSGRSMTVQSAMVEGSDLKIEVSYNCGCGDSNFFLQTEANFKESFPVQTDVSVVLKGKDNCEALCTDELCFDLTDLIETFKIVYPDDTSQLNINVADLADMVSVDI